MQDPYGLLASGLPPELAAQAMGLSRQQMVAQAMMQQSMKPIENMGGVGAKISPMQGLAQMLQAYVGKTNAERADKDYADLDSKKKEMEAEAVRNYMRQSAGTPAIQSPPDEMGGGPAAPAVAGDKRAAIAQALMSPLMRGNPLVSADLKALEKSQEPYSLRQGEQRFVGTQPVASNAPKPEAPKTRTIGTTLPNGQPGVIEQQYNPALNTWEPIKGAVATPKFAPPQNVSVNVSTEKKYGEKFAEGVAKSDVDLREASTKAPELADRSNRIAELLKGNIITGTAADFRLGFAKAAKLAGMSNSDAPENTEVLAASLSQNTLDAIKASGLGSGNGFSNADRDFLEKAAGGRITMEAGSLRRLAELAHRAASASAGRWNERVKSIPADALTGAGISRDAINVAPWGGGKSVLEQADAILRGNR